jgi:hypothetical protein
MNRAFPDHEIHTRSLAISGCMPADFTEKSQQLFDLSMVTSLTLSDCNLYLLTEHLAPVVELRNLTHFQCDTRDSFFPAHSSILHSFFTRNESLKHVHLNICSIADEILAPSQLESGSSAATGSFLWPLRRRLESLSWHDPGGYSTIHFSVKISSTSLTARSLECICHNFPRLQQLGIEAPEELHLSEDEKAKQTSVLHWKGRQTFLTYLVSRKKYLPSDCYMPAELMFHRSRSHISSISELSSFTKSL